jgi:glycosyltransferase involved in cell wall biosynthesis
MLSVVVPIFNERPGLEELHRRVTDAVAPLGAYELVLVDDGSQDGSWDAMLVLAARDSHVRLVRLSRNFGHQVALTAGLDAARGDAIVAIDADLQDPPEVIPELVTKWHEGYDVVYGLRAEREGESAYKLATASVFYKLIRRMSGQDMPEQAGDFRLLSRRAADALAQMPERARYLRGMTSWIGFRQTGVPYKRDARYAGETKYPTRKMLRFALDAITSFSSAPIKLVTALGFLIVVFCFGVLVWTLYTRFATNQAVQGWTSLLVVVLLLGGVQMLSLGVIGQYVARIFDESKRRPLYLVEEVVEGRSRAAEQEPRAEEPVA